MAGLDQARVDLVGKDVASQQRRNFAVESGDVGKPSAEDNHFRVDNVDHAGKGACELIVIALQRLLCLFNALLCLRHELTRVDFKAAAGRPAGAAEKGFNTVLFAAIAAARFAVG